MATSNSYNWTSTRNDLIQAAFRKINRLGDYESITDTANIPKLNAGIAAINPVMKALATKGMPLWAITEEPVAMTTFTTNAFVAIGPAATIPLNYKPLKLIQALRRDNISDSIDVDMNIYTKTDFLNLSAKESIGAPIHVEYQPLGYTGNIRVWPLPDLYWRTNGQLVLRFQRPFQDMDAAADEPDFPTEWHNALIYQLAVFLAPDYGLPMNDRQTLRQEAKEALDDALSFGTEEGSLYLMPERYGVQ